MNFFAISIVLMAIGGTAFGVLDGQSVITDSASAMLSIVSIMAAAILVRLNRGIPTVDWKSVDRGALDELLNRLEDIARAYIVTFIVTLIGVALIIWALLVNAEPLIYKELYLKLLAICFGIALGLIISRISYIIWLDLDIVRLQRAVIVSAAESVDAIAQSKVAADKIDQMDRVKVTPL